LIRIKEVLVVQVVKKQIFQATAPTFRQGYVRIICDNFNPVKQDAELELLCDA
jgi:hypothetical protein